MGSHFSSSHNFAIHHDSDHFFDHDRDHFHHRFFFSAFPFWPWYYPYYGYDDYTEPVYSDQYWSDITAAVQTELARDGYYHGQINGVVTSDTVNAIRAYRKAKGLPVTSLIRNLLKCLDI